MATSPLIQEPVPFSAAAGPLLNRPIASLHAVSKRYGKVQALDNFSLQSGGRRSCRAAGPQRRG